jgi:AraC-like DNA-binding protein
VNRLIDLINTIKKIIDTENNFSGFPFVIGTSLDERLISNITISKPLLIVLIKGDKVFYGVDEVKVGSGEYALLTNQSCMTVRNIAENDENLSFFIEFEKEDFRANCFLREKKLPAYEEFFSGNISVDLEISLCQFAAWGENMSPKVRSLRRKEIVNILYSLGHEDIFSWDDESIISQRVVDVIRRNLTEKVEINKIADELWMSESTLRRKLLLEGTSLQKIKDQVKLSYSLHLLQTTNLPIIVIAEMSGYKSSFRFSQRFEKHFGITPSLLRKSRSAVETS